MVWWGYTDEYRHRSELCFHITARGPLVDSRDPRAHSRNQRGVFVHAVHNRAEKKKQVLKGVMKWRRTLQIQSTVHPEVFAPVYLATQLECTPNISYVDFALNRYIISFK